MRYCPECNYEYDEGVVKCPKCSAEVVETLEPDSVGILPNQNLTVVFTAQEQTEAEIVKGILEEAGIPVFERSEFAKQPEPIVLGDLGGGMLAVPTNKADEAQKLIKHALERGKKLPSDSESAE